MTVQLNRVEFIHGLNTSRDDLVANITANVRRGLPEFRSRRAIFVGGGPSAGDHIDRIRAEALDRHEVWCVNGAANWLYSLGIVPDYCVIMDATENIGGCIKSVIPGTRYMMGSQVHPSAIDRILADGGDVMLWHAALDDAAHDMMGKSITVTSPANTVGLHALQLMCLSGIRQVRIYGMDSSHRPGQDHAYDNSHQRPLDEKDFIYQDKTYRSDGTWAAQAVMFSQMYPLFFRAGMRIEVIGDGLLPAMAREAHRALMQDLQNQANAEKDKG